MANKVIKVAIGILILSSVLFCVLPSDIGLIRFGANYTVHIMFANLLFGLIFLLKDQKELMFTSFIACAVLCLYLKNSSNNVLKLPTKTVEEVLNVAQFNIASSQENTDETIKSIKDTDADIISIQEVTPDWAMLLKEELSSMYPHKMIVHRMEDFLAVAIFSKVDFLETDTFYIGDIPNLAATVKCADETVTLISSFVYPELSSGDNKRVVSQFEEIKKYTLGLERPVIAIGDYNQLQFSNYLKEFKKETLLNDSRRFQFFDNPTDHILFSSHFNCVDFQTISNRYTNHLGIKGSYQLNNIVVDAQKKTSQF